MNPPLIGAPALAALLRDRPGAVLVCDCSFDLADPGAGARAYAQGHIPGAVYVHLDQVLSGAKTGANGRHPLPERERFAAAIAGLGAGRDTHVVAYDANGAMFAARLWWMLRWAGHAAVSVLDGGLAAWKEAGLPLSLETPRRAPGDLALRAPLAGTVDYAQVLQNLDNGKQLLVDARSPDRFRGENETLDPVGGHIPGARNRFFKDNLAPDGRFKPAAALRREFEALLDGHPAGRVVSQCGSGVTACHNILAMAIAGLPVPLLYPGSWSEWCAQPGAPLEREL